MRVFASAAALLLAASIASGADLISHFTFDSDYTNSADPALDSTLQNGTFIDSGAIVGDGAAYFDGFDDFASAGVDAVPGAGGAYYQGTVALWVRGDGGPSGSRVFMGQQNGNPATFGGDDRMSFQIDTNGAGSVQIFIRTHDGTETNNRLKFRHEEPGSTNEERFPTGWNDGEWRHLAYTWRVDASGTVADDVQIYIDGAPVGTVITEAALEADPAKSPILPWEAPGMFIGARNNRIAQGGTADAHFKGWLDDIRVYDDVLTAAEVQGLYRLGIPEPSGAALAGLAVVAGLRRGARRRG
ncbi:LamG-like jellyroll fold domain-containing protein [Botrimarina sp.]|uniref:LamG-like jellyroll fold domain-containing protein n=1 Tax=Botrimarina sp. TaxID=2795802 RepID=UPI0032ED2010